MALNVGEKVETSYGDLPPIMKDLKSPLFHDLKEDDIIEIEKKYIFESYNIKTIEDLILYLEIMRFLMIEHLPYEIYDFVFANKELFIEDNIRLLIETFVEFESTFIREIIFISDDISRIYPDGLSGNPMLKYYLFIHYGLINPFKWAIAKGHDIKYNLKYDWCFIAATSNKLETLKALLEMGYELEKDEEPLDDNEFPDDEDDGIETLCETLAGFGSLECLKFVREELGYYCSYKAIDKAVENDNLECLIYLYENGCPYNDETMYLVATKGNVECLSYLISKDKPITREAFNCMIMFDHDECLTYILSNISYPLEEYYYQLAISRNSVRCVKILHKFNCPWNPEHYKLAQTQDRKKIIEYFDTHGFSK